MRAKKKEKAAKRECQAETHICSNQMLVRYGVNGSEKAKPPETFLICGACMVWLKRAGAKFKQVQS